MVPKLISVFMSALRLRSANRLPRRDETQVRYQEWAQDALERLTDEANGGPRTQAH